MIDLEKIYSQYNNKKFLHPDPLEFLHKYQKQEDIEAVGLIASGLAYGRVCQILKSVTKVLDKLSLSPSDFIINTKVSQFFKIFKNFKHRFTTENELVEFLSSIKNILIEHKTIENAFVKSILHTYSCKNLTEFNRLLKKDLPYIQNNYKEVLINFYKKFNLKKNSLLSDPAKNSACKRLNLFLKWMIRCDEIDLGVWENISPEILIIPLDTHMYQFAKSKNFTSRKSADFLAALEITKAFKKYSPSDPTKYDFCITRFGIRSELDAKCILE